MVLKRAFQYTIPQEAQEEFFRARMRYSEACKKNARLRFLKADPELVNRLKWQEERELFKQECKEYYTARDKYQRVLLLVKAAQKGADLHEIARALDVDMSVAFPKLLKQIQQTSRVNSLTSEEIELCERAEALRNSSDRKLNSSSKEQWLKSDLTEDTVDLKSALTPVVESVKKFNFKHDDSTLDNSDSL